MKKYLIGIAAAAAGVALAMPATAQDDMDMERAHISISGSMNNDFGFGSYVGGKESADDFHHGHRCHVDIHWHRNHGWWSHRYGRNQA